MNVMGKRRGKGEEKMGMDSAGPTQVRGSQPLMSRVAHYRILEKLGAGGMGEVYLAEDTKLKRRVALKFLPASLTADAEARERFTLEAQSAAALHHPHIVTIYDIAEHEGQVFIAMEHVEGRTLKETMAGARGPLQLVQAVDIAIQVGQGLAAAHQKGIVHRDVKPANVIVDGEGRAKIVDFGLAKLRGQAKLTQTGSTLGTAAYMSPEQARGEEVDQRSDIWSLGVVLYEMLTGRLPFAGDYAQAVMYAIINEEPAPVASLRPGLPPEVGRIVGKLLAKERSERYQHGDDLVVDLKRLKRDSTPRGAIPAARGARRTNLFKRAAPPLLVVALLAAAYFAFWERGKGGVVPPAKPGTRHSLSVIYFENNSGDKNLDKWRSVLAELLITDISQSKYIEVVSGDQIFSIMKKLKLLEARKYTAEDLREVASRAGSDYVLKGGYVTAGKNLLITVALQEAATGKIVSSLSVEARGEEEIFPKVDEITSRIKLDFSLTPQQLASDPDRNLADITTHSPQALQVYGEGRSQYLLGRYRQALELFKKAVELDSQFATAYRGMAFAYDAMGFFPERRECLQKAMELGSRVSERERLRIEGAYLQLSEKTYGQAIHTFDNLLNSYTDDAFARNHLGWIYRSLEEWRKAEEQFRFNLHDPVEDDSHYSATGLSRLYISQGELKKCREMLEAYQSRYPEDPDTQYYLAWVFRLQGEYDPALAQVNRSLRTNPDDASSLAERANILFCRGNRAQAEAGLLGMRNIDHPTVQVWGLYNQGIHSTVLGRYQEARGLFQQVIDLARENKQPYWERTVRGNLAAIERASEEWPQALQECDSIWRSALAEDDLEWERQALHEKGLAHAGRGDLDKARQAAIELEKVVGEGPNRKWQRLVDHLRGVIELKAGNAQAAIELISRAIDQAPGGERGQFMISLAESYVRAGRLAEAARAYEAITLSPAERLNQDYPLSLFHLGRVYQQLGDREKALQNYSRFSELWKECDARFRPLLEQAKGEMEKLQAKR